MTVLNNPTNSESTNVGQSISQVPKTRKAIENWLVSHIAEMLDINPDKLDSDTPFDDYGLDSVAAVGLTGDLADWLGYEVDATLLYDSQQ